MFPLLLRTALVAIPSFVREGTDHGVQQNHDNQVNITHLEEIIRERQVSSFSYTRSAPPGVGGEGGPGNYWVPVSRKCLA